MKMAVYFEQKFPTWKTMMIGALACLSLTGCRDQDYDWEAAKMQSTIYTYKKNFEKIYGTIDPHQSWDFSMANKYSQTRAADESIVITDNSHTGVASATASGNNDWIEVDPATLAWMQDALFEGRDNKGQGAAASFSFMTQGEDFCIMPILQGQAGLTWDLHMYAEKPDGTTVTIKVWSKGQHLQKKTNNGSWDDVGTGRTDETKTTAVRAQYYRFSKTEYPLGTKLTFYLHITNWDTSGNGYATRNYQLSTQGMMRTLLVPADKMPGDSYVPSFLTEGKGTATYTGYEAAIIGCEDNDKENANANNTDWDYNDVVFLMTGKKIPAVVDIVSKRYMVEDLGNADDIDFNDIVVDLEQSIIKKPVATASGNVEYQDDPSTFEQTAIVRAMGGTLDFDFKIGNEIVFQKSAMENGTYSFSTMYNTEGTINYSAELAKSFRAEDGSTWTWTPSENNVSFVVYPSGRSSNGVATTITFPDLGEVPYIMAFDPTKQWRDERHTICHKWLNGQESGTATCNDCKDDKVFGK